MTETLGNILIYDPDGRRTAHVVPFLHQLADDPSVAVRACTAHLIAACLSHARVEAVRAFERLIQADDRLLATRHVESLIVYIGHSDVSIIRPVIQRMISSADAWAREAGGRLAAYVGLEFDSLDLLVAAQASSDTAVRKGAAYVCASRLPHTNDAAAAGEAIRKFVNDSDIEVRKEVAKVAPSLRGHKLRLFKRELEALIQSPAFEYALPQLLITLDRAPDRVDGLIVATAKRFIELHGASTADISTGAAGEARQVSELLLRAYEQAANPNGRGAVLDLIDKLLFFGAYGMAELIEVAER
jgi:hypothetical protein